MSNQNLIAFLVFGSLFAAVPAKPQSGGQMPPNFERDVEAIVANLNRIETDTLRELNHTTLDRQGQIRTLGKLLIFDKHLSVNQNEACSFVDREALNAAAKIHRTLRQKL